MGIESGSDFPYLDLNSTNEEILKLDQVQRLERLKKLIAQSNEILDVAINEFITSRDKKLSKIVVLFSGGNDSTALLYLMKGRADCVVHINTGTGVPDTYDYVVETCKELGIELHTFASDEKDNYRNLVFQYGFPGPGQHFFAYQRLKERALRKARRHLNTKGQRIVFVSGKRRDESARRSSADCMSRVDSVVWVSPMVNWTKTDIETFRKITPEMRKNPVADLIHMSGECLCGAFAHKGEREEIRFFFPEVIEKIEQLEKEVMELGTIPKERCNWGWGAYRESRPSKKTGELCSSCVSAPQFETEKASHKGAPQFETDNCAHKGAPQFEPSKIDHKGVNHV